ncbi:hypothetical protein GGI43DRAFT_325240 [Trichoderma evansii]
MNNRTLTGIMDCMRGCSYIVPARGDEPEYENPINFHWQVSHYGHHFYFCATHRAYHCMFIDGNVEQPCCGECATFYYQGSKNIIWEADYDRPAEQHNDPINVAYELIMMNHANQTNNEANDQHLHTPAADTVVGNDQETPANLLAMPSPSDFPDDEIEVPRDDPTYRGLGTVLVGNPRQRGLWRLSFRNYAGEYGWMPCGRDIGQRAVFLNLAKHEEHGDPVFKRARLWACQVQGHLHLHKDIRWVLWNIYMLSNDVLYNNQETDEQVSWKMREWLHALYVTAMKLFDDHQIAIPVPMPELDWFNRPPVAAAEQEAMGGQPNTTVASDTGSGDGLPHAVDLAIADLAIIYDSSSAEDTPDGSDSESDF